MSDKPILFSGPMVRALLDGSKTQTRRLINPQPSKPWGSLFNEKGKWWTGDDFTAEVIETLRVPYVVDDRLWVRETWTARMTHGWTIADARSRMFDEEILYAADDVDGIDGWWPSIHLPREFSRLTLTVTGVRVQRLQEISEEDARAEGARPNIVDGPEGWEERTQTDYRGGYRTLWDSLNGKPGRKFGWDVNPWIAAVTFDVARCNIDAVSERAA